MLCNDSHDRFPSCIYTGLDTPSNVSFLAALSWCALTGLPLSFPLGSVPLTSLQPHSLLFNRIVEPEVNDEGHRPCEIVYLESIYHSAHLIGVYGKEFIPKDLRASDSLDAYRAFWVGKYIDYHAHGHVY